MTLPTLHPLTHGDRGSGSGGVGDLGYRLQNPRRFSTSWLGGHARNKLFAHTGESGASPVSGAIRRAPISDGLRRGPHDPEMIVGMPNEGPRSR